MKKQKLISQHYSLHNQPHFIYFETPTKKLLLDPNGGGLSHFSFQWNVERKDYKAMHSGSGQLLSTGNTISLGVKHMLTANCKEIMKLSTVILL